jgi:hypothetical protein
MSEPSVDRKGLFNEIEDGQVYPANDKWYSHLVDQYKIYVEMADRISTRRATANSYFLSINSAILAFVGYLAGKDQESYLWIISIAGITLTVFWRAMIRSYRDLNTAKWLVVHQIERRLPISPYDAEWDAMGEGKNPKLYRPITHIEMNVPLVFTGLHFIVLLKTFPYFPSWVTSMF